MGRPKGPGGNIVFGLRIVQLRKLKGLTQRQLGEAIGVTFQQIQKYEKGTNGIPSERLKRIADALGVSVDQLNSAHADLTPSVALPSDALAIPGAIALLDAFGKITKPDLREAALAAVTGIAEASATKAPTRPKLIDARTQSVDRAPAEISAISRTRTKERQR